MPRGPAEPGTAVISGPRGVFHSKKPQGRQRDSPPGFEVVSPEVWGSRLVSGGAQQLPNTLLPQRSPLTPWSHSCGAGEATGGSELSSKGSGRVRAAQGAQQLQAHLSCSADTPKKHIWGVLESQQCWEGASAGPSLPTWAAGRAPGTGKPPQPLPCSPKPGLWAPSPLSGQNKTVRGKKCVEQSVKNPRRL